MSKDEMVKEISRKSNRYGNLLIKMLDKYNVDGLVELSEEQVRKFYEEEKIYERY